MLQVTKALAKHNPRLDKLAEVTYKALQRHYGVAGQVGQPLLPFTTSRTID